MRILLTGAKGQVGRSLRQHKPDNWEMIAADSNTLNITDADAIANMIRSFEPDVIINAAGFTDLNTAENQADLVFATNAIGVRNLAEAAAQANIRFIHISSDYVFDGKQSTPYSERDVPNPLSVYAKSKLAGELLALSTNPDSIIIRSSWVFSEYGCDFVQSLIHAKQNEIAIRSDQVGCPTYAGDLAKLMIMLAQDPALTPGIYHYCGDVAVNRFEFAQTVCRILEETSGIQIKVKPLEGKPEEENTPRPAYSVLDCSKLRKLGFKQSNWQAALRQILPHMLNP